MKRRPPLDTGGGRATGPTELIAAVQVIEKAGVLAVLTPLIETGVGRPRTLILKAFLVAAQVNAMHRRHQGHLVEIARVLNAMTKDQLASLGVTGWDPAEAYDRVARLFIKLCAVLEAEPVMDAVPVSASWFANRIALPRCRPSSGRRRRWRWTGRTWRPGEPCTGIAPPWTLTVKQRRRS
ncbi:MAG: hypothetical protein JWM17_2788 [Actinobacteria bacterium]|nr:hypothetical protein [Actinomycetota bacterium]